MNDLNKYNKMGPTLTGGDFNARITNEVENYGIACIGKHISDKENVETTLDESTMENRDQLIAHCGGMQNIIISTFFEKKTVSYVHTRVQEKEGRTTGRGKQFSQGITIMTQRIIG